MRLSAEQPFDGTDRFRGYGRTTMQMRAAKPNAFFVWCGNELKYPTCLAYKLGRQDLQIKPIGSLLHGNHFQYFGFRRDRELIVDHAALWPHRHNGTLLSEMVTTLYILSAHVDVTEFSDLPTEAWKAQTHDRPAHADR